MVYVNFIIIKDKMLHGYKEIEWQLLWTRTALTDDNYRQIELQIFLDIQDEFRQENPFPKLPSKLITAIILSYTGFKIEVCPLL